MGVIFAHAHIADRFSAYDHLTAGIAVRFQENRIHADVGVKTASLRLNHLRASHLPAVHRDKRIQRHVLRLERRHVIAVLKENAAQGCRENAFSCIGAGALNHQGRFGSLTDNGGAVSRQFGAQSFRQQSVFLRRADAGAQPAARFQPRIIGTVAQRDTVFFQEPGCQAMRRPRQAEEKEVGLGREYGGARQGGEPAEQVVPAFPVPGAFPVCPGGGLCQHGLHRCRRKGIHVPGGQGLPQPLRERSGTDGKTAPDAGHAVKFGQGAQNHQVGKEGRFTEQ